MFSTVLKEVTGLFDRRFLLNLFFPSLIFWALLVIVWFAGKGQLAEAAQAWNQQEATLLTIEIIGFLAWVIIFGYVLGSQLTAILKLYEGYWDFPAGRFFKALGTRRHRQRLAKLYKESASKQTVTYTNSPPDSLAAPPGESLTDLRNSQILHCDDLAVEVRPTVQVSPPRESLTSLLSYQEIYLHYPQLTQQQHVMPTLLGNILKNAELYPRDRYRIDSVLLWPRLYNLFPERFINLIAEVRTALDFMLVIASLSIAFAVLSGAYLLIVRAEWWLFLICFWGGLLVARTAYHGAVGNALLFAQQIKAAFDLYRFELLKQMHISLPPTLADERDVWRDLCRFLYRNYRPHAYTYSHPNPSPPDKG